MLGFNVATCELAGLPVMGIFLSRRNALVSNGKLLEDILLKDVKEELMAESFGTQYDPLLPAKGLETKPRYYYENKTK